MGDVAKGLNAATAAVIEQSIGADDGPWREGQQLPLLENGAEVVELLNGRPTKPARGRPPGAKNKRTEAWVDYLAAKYSDPREVLAQCYSRNTHSLALELGCTVLEAYKVQQAAATALLPYVAQKQPQALEVKHRSGIFVAIMGLTEVADADPADLPEDDYNPAQIEHESY